MERETKLFKQELLYLMFYYVQNETCPNPEIK